MAKKLRDGGKIAKKLRFYSKLAPWLAEVADHLEDLETRLYLVEAPLRDRIASLEGQLRHLRALRARDNERLAMATRGEPLVEVCGRDQSRTDEELQRREEGHHADGKSQGWGGGMGQ